MSDAKKKVNRVSNTRRPRIPNGHERVEVILPKETCHRIGEHVLRHEGLTVQDFLKKAIYDALPVHYEVTEDFVFPFGKYAGETAGVVNKLDPSYIKWCETAIKGFVNKMKSVTDESKQINTTRSSDHWRSLLQPGEALQFNTGNNVVWAYKRAAWGEKYGWRKLGYWTFK